MMLSSAAAMVAEHLEGCGEDIGEHLSPLGVTLLLLLLKKNISNGCCIWTTAWIHL